MLAELGDRSYTTCKTQAFISFYLSEIKAELTSLFVKNINKRKAHTFDYYSFPVWQLTDILS